MISYNKINESDLTLGSLHDEWEMLEKILNNKQDPIGYSAVWLAAIMHSVGENVIE